MRRRVTAARDLLRLVPHCAGRVKILVQVQEYHGKRVGRAIVVGELRRAMHTPATRIQRSAQPVVGPLLPAPGPGLLRCGRPGNGGEPHDEAGPLTLEAIQKHLPLQYSDQLPHDTESEAGTLGPAVG